MPFTWNGCGTRYCGKREVGADGSYITTEWVTLVWVPLVPLRSFRVLPTGKGFNIGIAANQGYMSARVPLHWIQVRNVYLIALPFIVLIAIFSYGDIVSDLRSKSAAPAPIVAPVALPSEAPIADPKTACGTKIKLDKDGMVRLNIRDKMNAITDQANFTEEEKKGIGDVSEDAFEGYALGFLTWQKPREEMKGTLDQAIEKETSKATLDAANQSAAYKEAIDGFLARERVVITKGFLSGRSDARLSPCPY